MTSMSGTGKYFKQPAVAISFALLTIAGGKHIRNGKQRAGQELLKWKGWQVQPGAYFSGVGYSPGAIAWEGYPGTTEIIPGSTEQAYDDHSSDEQIAGIKIFSGFRMDGDDTLMSPEERLRIIFREKRGSAAPAGNAI
ncbi:MAG: hypothetical protein KF746_09615 [Chitinophagaceae bacterium]|nr:hypothetical protein [Chitinophagaceae bacterium]